MATLTVSGQILLAKDQTLGQQEEAVGAICYLTHHLGGIASIINCASDFNIGQSMIKFKFNCTSYLKQAEQNICCREASLVHAGFTEEGTWHLNVV